MALGAPATGAVGEHAAARRHTEGHLGLDKGFVRVRRAAAGSQGPAERARLPRMPQSSCCAHLPFLLWFGLGMCAAGDLPIGLSQSRMLTQFCRPSSRRPELGVTEAAFSLSAFSSAIVFEEGPGHSALPSIIGASLVCMRLPPACGRGRSIK